MSEDKALARYADAAMFKAAPIEAKEPEVHLLWMTPDPLGAIAAMCRMYEGHPTYNLQDISRADKEHYWEQVKKTHLKAPLEAVKFHFFIEGVDRSFTHQMVRQRTAVYAQESMRFAVKENMADEVQLPPSIPAGTKEADLFFDTVGQIQNAYDQLILMGVPAEDARGLMPHATPTRLNYVTDLRALADHSGNRLCTQAQFVWRKVFLEISKVIGKVEPRLTDLFKPVCYQQGKCTFKAEFDRGCTIRERVDAFEKKGVPSSEWGKGWEDDTREDLGGERIEPINPAEWMLFHDSAYVKPGDKHGDQSHRQ